MFVAWVTRVTPVLSFSDYLTVSIYGVFIYTKCNQPAVLAEAIYTNSAHHCLVGPEKSPKTPVTGQQRRSE